MLLMHLRMIPALKRSQKFPLLLLKVRRKLKLQKQQKMQCWNQLQSSKLLTKIYCFLKMTLHQTRDPMLQTELQKSPTMRPRNRSRIRRLIRSRHPDQQGSDQICRS